MHNMEQIQRQMLDKQEQRSHTHRSRLSCSAAGKEKVLNNVDAKNKDGRYEMEQEADANQIQILHQLLQKLGMQKTLNTFEAQKKSKLKIQNPELISKQQVSLQIQQQMKVKYLTQLVRQCSSLQQILQQLSAFISNSSEQKAKIQDKKKHLKLTKVLQELFSAKATATIPIFRVLSIQLRDRKLLFVDINEFQGVCFVDSENYLHVVDQKQNLRSSKIEGKRDVTVMGIKWLNHKQFVVGTTTHKFLIYSSSNLQLVKILRPGKMKISYLDIHKIQSSYGQNSIVTVAQSTSNSTIITKLTQQQKEIRLEKKYTFDWGHPLQNSAVLKIAHVQKFTHYIDKQVQFIVSNSIEHYYGLNFSSNAIIKFDTTVNRAGVIWKTQYGSVVMMEASNCRFYLHLIVNNNHNQILTEYQYLKLNGHGGIITRISLDLNNVLMGGKLQKILMLDCNWLCCTVFRNSLIYFSLCTGKVVYIQQIEQVDEGQLSLGRVGPNNCILLQFCDQMRLLSTSAREPKKIYLDYQMIEEQDEVMLQFARIRGIPGNFLHFLQSIRNQQRLYN